MAALKQIDANRRNALRSTGPRTDAGKQASSRNALKSGIFAEAETIPGEDPNTLAQLTAEHHARFHPQIPEARDLVDSLIRHAWLLRRLARAEAAIFNCDCPQCEKLFAGRSDKARISGCYFVEMKKLDLIQRRINATERNYHRTLKALQNLPANLYEAIYQNEENEPNSTDSSTESTIYPPTNSSVPEVRQPGAPAPILHPTPDSRPLNPAFFGQSEDNDEVPIITLDKTTRRLYDHE